MPHLPPLDRDEIDPALLPKLDQVEALMGFVPNDGLTIARMPALFQALLDMTHAIYAPSTLDPATKRLVGLAASAAAGCSYCKAHTLYSATKFGVPQDVLNAVVYDQPDALEPALALATEFARRTAAVPADVDDAFMARLKEHFDDQGMCELLAVISLFGFLNRWNAGNQTEVEAEPAACMI